MNGRTRRGEPFGRACAMRSRERGSALLVALFLALVVSGLCTTLLLTSSANHLVAANERDRDRAMFASKAGLNYGFYLYLSGTLEPVVEGTSFDSFDEGVSSPLEGASFTGRVYDEGDGLYRMVSTGNYNRSNRTTELVFQTAPDLFKYGFVGFNDVSLHVHSPFIHEAFEINSTVFSNGRVEMHSPITLNGSIVASSEVEIGGESLPSVVNGNVFAYEVKNDGVLRGNLGLLASVVETTDRPEVVDQQGNAYEWYRKRDNPDSYPKGSGTVTGEVSRYVVQNGDAFRFSIFNDDGTLNLNPDLNVIRYLPPPLLDYAAMKAAADENEPTYFETMFEAVRYLTQHKVVEVVDGETLTTVKIGSVDAPEFLYVADDLELTFDPDVDRDIWSIGQVRADGLHIEGGIFTAGDFSFDGKLFTAPDRHPEGYDQLRINALPYCFPAIVSYSEPRRGSLLTWTPEDTPVMMKENKSSIEVRSHNVGPIPRHQGPVTINGLTFAENESHFHHMSADVELITFRGAQLANTIHNCDYFNFTYDPAVGCTQFLQAASGSGQPSVVSYRELR